MTVEDILSALCTLVIKNVVKDQWHRSFIESVQNHVTMGHPLSTNQATIVLKTAEKFVADVAKIKGYDTTATLSYIRNPQYRNSPYQSASIKREVRYLGSDKLAFRFKHDATVILDIKGLKSANDIIPSNPKWNNQFRIWIVTVTPGNLEKVFGLIKRHKFEFDEAVLEYMQLSTNSRKVPSTFVMDEDGDYVYANICNNPVLAYVVEHVMGGEPL